MRLMLRSSLWRDHAGFFPSPIRARSGRLWVTVSIGLSPVADLFAIGPDPPFSRCALPGVLGTGPHLPDTHPRPELHDKDKCGQTLQHGGDKQRRDRHRVTLANPLKWFAEDATHQPDIQRAHR